MHASKKGKAQGLAGKQPSARKVATIAGILGLAALLASTLALRSQLSKVVEGIKKAGLGEASLGSGFNRECFALSIGSVSKIDLAFELSQSSSRELL